MTGLLGLAASAVTGLAGLRAVAVTGLAGLRAVTGLAGLLAAVTGLAGLAGLLPCLPDLSASKCVCALTRQVPKSWSSASSTGRAIWRT